MANGNLQSEIKQIRLFSRVFFSSLVLLFLFVRVAVVGVGVAVRQWINASWWPFALYDAHPNCTNCDEIQTSAFLTLCLSVARTLFFYLLIRFSVDAQILLYILRILSFQCLCEISFIRALVILTLSQTIRSKFLLSVSFSFSLLICFFFRSLVSFSMHIIYWIFFSLQRLNFINSNKTDKIKINGIWWRNRRERNGREKQR